MINVFHRQRWENKLNMLKILPRFVWTIEAIYFYHIPSYQEKSTGNNDCYGEKLKYIYKYKVKRSKNWGENTMSSKNPVNHNFNHLNIDN